jgi:hypothetical protein
MNGQRRTLQEFRTTLPTAGVIAAAREYFARRLSIYAAFVEKEGPDFLTLRGQGGEEIAIAAAPDGSGSKVTASSYLFDGPVSRFFATLPPAPEVAA